MNDIIIYLSKDSENFKHTLEKAKNNNNITIWGFKPVPRSKPKKIEPGNKLLFLYNYDSKSETIKTLVVTEAISQLYESKLPEWPDEKEANKAIYSYRVDLKILCLISNVALASLNKYVERQINLPFLGFQYNTITGNICKEISSYNSNFSKLDNNAFINNLLNSLHSAGLIYSRDLVVRFVAALKAKPFVILTGLTGSGKTKLAQAFALWISDNEEQYEIISVGADWTNRDNIFGYVNALNPDEYIKPENGALDILIRANKKPDKPYFLILDEMNLSHVERYFADFLSVMESKEKFKLHSHKNDISGVPAELSWPDNLFVIGTVNVDETTYMFSPKVLDRAQVLEFRVIREQMKNFLQNTQEINLDSLRGQGADFAHNFLKMKSDIKQSEELDTELISFFEYLSEIGAEFGYRTAIEIKRFIAYLGDFDNELSEEEKMDFAVIQKLLPKLHGSRRKIVPVLEKLAQLCIEDAENKTLEDLINEQDNLIKKYPLTFDKIIRMYRNAISNGYTSFAEA